MTEHSTHRDLAAAELTLLGGEQRLRELLDAAPLAFLSLDAEGLVLDWNPGAEALFGWTRAEAIGRPFAQLVPSLDATIARPGEWPAVDPHQASPRQFELCVARRDGEELPAHVTASRVEAGDSHVFHVFVRDLSEIRQMQHDCDAAERQLMHQALYDPLTGIPNRAQLLDRLHHALAPPSFSRSTAALLQVDVDNFRLISDGLGYRAGDEVLAHVVDRIRHALRRREDIARCDRVELARVGGDEFAVLCEGLGRRRDAIELARHIIASAAQEPVTVAGETLFVTVSVGIAFATHSTTADSLLRDAGTAMHSAKDRGRNRYELFDSRAHTSVVTRVRRESELRGALAEDQLRVHYQPIVTIATAQAVGFEALLRWQHPDHGLVPPGEFMPLAEESGLIIPIGRWVLRQACAQLAEWQRSSPAAASLSMAVNVSGRQVVDDDIVQAAEEILVREELDPSQLTLEITESSFVDDSEASLTTLQELRKLGIQLALDDFGTGYSSLGYLRHLPFNVLKLDRSFIANLEKSAADPQIVGAMIALARAMSMTVIAEGVETREQLAYLEQLDCPMAQGFLFGRPMPPEDARRWFQSGPPAPHARSVALPAAG